MQTQISWETNEAPRGNGEMMFWSPSREQEALSAAIPFVQMLAGKAHSDLALAQLVVLLMDYMRERGVEADPGSIQLTMLQLTHGKKRMDEILADCDEADEAIQFILIAASAKRCAFWAQRTGRASSWIHGSLEELRERGYDIVWDHERNEPKSVELTASWLQTQGLEVVAEVENVFLVRRLVQGESRLGRSE